MKMSCEEFMSDYHSTPVNLLPMFYEDTSVFDEICCDGQWTEPLIGADRIVPRLVTLELVGDRWPIETCQQLPSGGVLVVLGSVNKVRQQILIMYRLRTSKYTTRMVVSNHFYLPTATSTDIGDEDLFKKKFVSWATSLDSVTRRRAWMAFNTGIAFVLSHYTSGQDKRSKNQKKFGYNNNSWFSCLGYEVEGNHVCKSIKLIRKQYNSLALNYQCVSLRSIKTYWCRTSPKARNMKVVVLVEGIVPDVSEPKKRFNRKFVQLFVIDSRTRKIHNDVLLFEPRRTNKRSRRRTVTSFDWSSDDDQSSVSSLSTISQWSTDGSLASTSCKSRFDSDNEELTTDASTALRLRITNSILKIRSTSKGVCDQQQQNGNAMNVNPRQLFIGCVPLHVKYGQLKLLFERFGEVTYVKVYEGYSKQTGAKMFHNYAFLFFKDEASVQKAIAASPVPLDSTWSLNVSRPHHHTSSATSTSRLS